jgi:hypothetical protein
MAHPATKKRGGNPDVKHKPEHKKPKDAMERKLEQGLEDSMAGSDLCQTGKTQFHAALDVAVAAESPLSGLEMTLR